MYQESNIVTEKGVLSELTSQRGLYAPLEITSVKERIRGDVGSETKVTIRWQGRNIHFIAAVKTRTAPKLISEGLRQLRKYATLPKQNLLLIVPFLTKTIVEMLEREALSGLDLNGNYLIQSSEMVAIRLDRKNQFRESQSIKKIFSGNSSLVGRLFLLSAKRHFRSVNEIYSSIQNLDGSLSLSAVSKVLKGLEDELIIQKGREEIVLIQPDKLLQRLEEDCRLPKIVATMRLKLPTSDFSPLQGLGKLLPPPIRWVLSGESSAERYAVTTPAEIATIYTTDFGSLTQYENERFYNVVLKKTFDSFPYFDSREHDRLRWSSPIQCYLELAKLDKREQELARSVRQAILENLK